MILYSSPWACSMASHIALLEADADFDIDRIHYGSPPVTSGGRNYLEINPKGFVPALKILEGKILTENIAILLYIADRYPAARLAPPFDTEERYRMLEWLGFLNSDLHRCYTPLFKAVIPDEGKTFYRERLDRFLELLDSVLGERKFLMGSGFSVADCYLVTVLSWSPMVDVDLSGWPSVKSYFERLMQRSMVARAVEWQDL